MTLTAAYIGANYRLKAESQNERDIPDLRNPESSEACHVSQLPSMCLIL